MVHEWQWRDPRTGDWTTQQRISVSIFGGRENGFRYYTIKTAPRPGQWRVNILTFDDRPVGRVRFAVEEQAVPPAQHTVLLK
jgi:hypothetical protein